MANRKKTNDRALGPYRYPKRVPGVAPSFPGEYRVVVVVVGRPRKVETKPFTTAATEKTAQADAQSLVDSFNEEAQLAGGVTIGDGLDEYPRYLAKAAVATAAPPMAADGTRRKPRKAKRLSSIRTDMFRLRNFFPDRLRSVAIADFSEADALTAYNDLAARAKSEATLLYTLATARKFWGFCVEKKWARTNVLFHLRPALNPNEGGKGKAQLNFDQLMRWRDKAFELAGEGDDGAVAGLLALELGPRAEIIVTRRGWDVDLGGRILRTLPIDAVPNPTKKTPDFVQVEDEQLQQFLLGLKGADEEWLFPTSGRVRAGRRRFTEAQRRQILAEYDATSPRRGGPPESHAASAAVLEKYGIDAALIFRWRRRPPGPPQPAPLGTIDQGALPLAKGHRDRSWVAAQIRRICRAAGLPETTHAHGMRGASMSTDLIEGALLDAVQREHGHRVGTKVTRKSYVTADTFRRRRQRMWAKMAAMDGGKADGEGEGG